MTRLLGLLTSVLLLLAVVGQAAAAIVRPHRAGLQAGCLDPAAVVGLAVEGGGEVAALDLDALDPVRRSDLFGPTRAIDPDHRNRQP